MNFSAQAQAVLRRPAAGVVLSALLAAAVLLPGLGSHPLNSWDEAIYAEVAREFLRTSGHWLTPMWNGQVWLEKPPLLFWITSLFLRLPARHVPVEFWARLPSALAGVGCVAVLHGWMRARFRAGVAWLATLILLSTFGFLHPAHVAETDVLLSLGCLVGVIGLAEVPLDALRGWMLFSLGFSIAAMTKGAACLPLLLTVPCAAVLCRWGWRRFQVPFVAAVLLAAALVLPWHVAMWQMYPQQFGREYLGYHVLARAAQPLENHVTHWWFYLLVLAVSAPLWSWVFPFALPSAWRRVELRPLIAFAVITVVGFSVARTRLPHYVAPVYAVLACVVAVGLEAWLEGLHPTHRQGRDALGTRLSWLGRIPHLRGEMWGTPVLVLAVVFGACAGVTAGARGRLHRAPAAVGDEGTDREIAALLKAAGPLPAGQGSPLLVWRSGPPASVATALFYAGRRVQQVSLMPAIGVEDRYLNKTVLLQDAVPDSGAELLVSRSLLVELPAGLQFVERGRSEHLLLGILVKRP